jgi:trehalose 6-phosphate synthase
VQARFAAALRPQLRHGDRIWVHDYHLMPLGRELRRLGWTGRIGFFLHVPFPPYELWQLLPDPAGLLSALFDYDLIGFQTEGGLDNYRYCCRRLLGAEEVAGRLRVGSRTQAAGVYPVGIDPDSFRPVAGVRERPARGDLTRVVRGRRLILGVDRLDYTKGIPERILAYEEFLRRYPQWRKKVSLVQIASPSREAAPLYIQQKRILDHIIGRVNGEMAEHDWVPIRYLYRSYPRPTLARFYRDAAIGLVTPLRDGMNLVAKEFVAAQRPEDPGVLILSRGAGACDELPEAVIVNAVLPADVADGIAKALAMPIEERIARHRALLDRVRAGSVQVWSARFLEDLEGATRSFATGAGLSAPLVRRGSAGDRFGRRGA